VPARPEEAAPDRRLDRAADLSTAFLPLLQRLPPTERAAFLLRDAMGADYAAIAATLGRTEAAARQIVHRARARLARAEGNAPRRPVSPEAHRRLLLAFLRASRDGDAAALHRLLAEDATWTADGGGKVLTALNVIRGRDRILRLALGLRRRLPRGLEPVPAWWNGRPGMLGVLGGAPWYAMQVVASGESGDRIRAVHVLRNPDKLRPLAAGLSQPARTPRQGG
jgi:RNA polymerase sigma-70 factor, ECF subfamily